MSNQTPEVIAKYEVLFGVRTGVTVLLPKVEAFDGETEASISFDISRENPQDMIIHTQHKPVMLKNLKKNYLDDAVTRGFIMFYETKDDAIIRSLPCRYQKT